MGDVDEEFVGAKVLDVDISQLAATTIDGVNAHFLEVVGHVVEVTEILHIDCTPHGRKGLYRYCVAACTPSGRSLRDRLRPASGESTPSRLWGDPASSGTPLSSGLFSEPLSYWDF